MTIPMFDIRVRDSFNPRYHVSDYVTVRILKARPSFSTGSITFALIGQPENYACFEFEAPVTSHTPVVFAPLMPVDPETTHVAWDFGDGTTSTAITPTHTYTSTGPYTVSLTIIPSDQPCWSAPGPFSSRVSLSVSELGAPSDPSQILWPDTSIAPTTLCKTHLLPVMHMPPEVP